MATSGEQRTGRHALVTGATGFIGGHLVAALVADGWHVDALVRRNDTGLPDGVAEHVIPREVDDLTALVGALRPEVCFHLATAFRGVHTPADIEPMVEANIQLRHLPRRGDQRGRRRVGS